MGTSAIQNYLLKCQKHVLKRTELVSKMSKQRLFASDLHVIMCKCGQIARFAIREETDYKLTAQHSLFVCTRCMDKLRAEYDIIIPKVAEFTPLDLLPVGLNIFLSPEDKAERKKIVPELYASMFVDNSDNADTMLEIHPVEQPKAQMPVDKLWHELHLIEPTRELTMRFTVDGITYKFITQPALSGIRADDVHLFVQLPKTGKGKERIIQPNTELCKRIIKHLKYPFTMDDSVIVWSD
jgi:RNase P subunit RPR2